MFLGGDAVRSVQSKVAAAHCRLTCFTLLCLFVHSIIVCSLMQHRLIYVTQIERKDLWAVY